MINRIFIFSFILLSGFAQGQDLSDTTSILLEEVTIKSDVFEVEKKDFGGSVSTVTPQVIQKSDGVYLQTILNSVPGVYMQTGALNTNRITIRGIGSRTPFGTDKIKAYLDEIPLSTGEGETTVEDIDFGTLQGIEVYRGPTSTTYGAGLGGAIHMLTQRPEEGAGLSAGYMRGSYGLQKFDLSGQIGDRGQSLSLYFQDVSSDGYRDNNEYDRRSLTLISKVRVGSKSAITGYFNMTDLIAQIPSSINKATYDSIPTAAEPRWNDAEGFEDNQRLRLGLSIASTLDRKTEGSLAAFANLGVSDEVRPTFLGNLESTFRNYGFRGKIRRKMGIDNQFALALGGEVFFEDFEYQEYENRGGQNGLKTLDFDQSRSYGNVFLIGEYRPSENWIVSLGGNVNFSNYTNEDRLATDTVDYSRDYSFGSIFSPKVSISRSLTERITAYMMYSHGFSLPTFEQTLYPQGEDDRINEDIKEEVGNNYEIGIKGYAMDSKIYFELAGYMMDVKDMLVTQDLPTGTYSVNAGSADYNGLEFVINHKIVVNENLNLSHSLSASWMNYTFSDFVHQGNDHSGNIVTGVPDYTVDYAVFAKTGMGVYGSANFQSVGKIYLRDDNTEYNDPYNLVNVKFGYEKDLAGLTFNAYLGVNNLFDTKYASMIQPNAFGGRYYYPGLPANYFGGLKVSYSFK